MFDLTEIPFLSLFKICARISEISRTNFSFVLISCANSNSYVNFVHAIRDVWYNLEKVHTNSREFVKVMLRMACTVYKDSGNHINNLTQLDGCVWY